VERAVETHVEAERALLAGLSAEGLATLDAQLSRWMVALESRAMPDPDPGTEA
jgi:hypothetical protein